MRISCLVVLVWFFMDTSRSLRVNHNAPRCVSTHLGAREWPIFNAKVGAVLVSLGLSGLGLEFAPTRVLAADDGSGVDATAPISVASSISRSDGDEMNSPMKKMPRTKGKYRPRAYSIEFTSPPSMQPRTLKGESSLIQRLGRARVLLLSFNQYDTPPQSVKFTQSLLERIVTEAQKKGDKDAVVTLALDEGIPAVTRESFENMDVVKKKEVRVVSVGVGAETIARVEKKGFEGLTDGDRAKYVPDPTDFVQSVATKGFKRYADASIVDDYNRDAQRLMKKAADMPSSEKYFAKEILQNEGIAAQLARSVAGKPSDLTVLVTDNSRVRFGYGVKERTLKLLQVLEAGGGGGGSAAAIAATGNPDRVLSVMIDPTAADSLSATAQLRLSLAYGQYLGDQRPLADFVWFSETPPLKIIARPKNPINKEGDKPAGESSVIGAFNARS